MEKQNKIKNNVIKMLKESDDTFFYLAPDVVGSINNANLDLKNNTFKINFSTTDGSKMDLKVPYDSFSKWHQENNDSEIKDFLIKFIECSKQLEEEEMLDEIVDEYGEIMGDDDRPSNHNFSSVGKSKFGTDKTIKQTIPKSKRFYGDLGLGVISW